MQEVDENEYGIQSIFDPEPVEDEDLFYLPATVDASEAGLPWAIAPKEAELAPDSWRRAEATCYRSLIKATEAVAKFSEAMRHQPAALEERFAVSSVAALLQDEGIWLGAERIALYRLHRLASDDTARDLSRADWAVRRLVSKLGIFDDLHAFLGRVRTEGPEALPGDDRLSGDLLDRTGHEIGQNIAGLSDCHALTRAAYAYALWRANGVTPWEERLEPAVAVSVLSGGVVLPWVAGHRIDLVTGDVSARLDRFFNAVEAGAVQALYQLKLLENWHQRASRETADLSGRTVPMILDTVLRHPLITPEMIEVSAISARRNLNALEGRGLLREITGQGRFRVWAPVLARSV